MKLALVQPEITADKASNLQLAVRTIRDAANRKTDLIVFPEMFMALPAGDESLASQAEPLDGPFVLALAEVARAHAVNVICGIWEHAPNATRVFNTVVAITSAGKLAATYRKLHLFDALSVRESDQMLRGEEHPPVLTLGSTRVGLAICYDLRFPELFRDLVDRGADVIVVPSAWYAGPFKEDHWLTLLRARAIENTVYVAAANLTGRAFAGRTSLIDPFGVVKATANEGADVVFGETSASRITEVRKKLPTITHRRTDLYPTAKVEAKAGA